MNNNESFLNQIHSKTPARVALILLFKYSTSKSYFLIYLALFFKLFGLVIITSNFVMSQNSGKKYHLRGTHILRYGTLFQLLLQDISLFFYQILCLVIYVIEIGFAVYIIILLLRIRKKKFDGLYINFFGKLCFYFNLLFSQHILEFLGFIFFHFFSQKVTISTDLYGDQYKHIPILSFNEIKYYNLFFLIPNAIIYIFVNFVIYYTFFVLNSTISLEDSPMKFRHNSPSIFGVICQILFSLHYLEIFVSEFKIGLLLVKVVPFILIIIGVGWYYYSSLKQFEFNNWLGWLTQIILLYTMFSCVLEMLLSFGNYELSYVSIIIIMIIKIVIAVIFTWIYYYVKYRFLLMTSSDSLYSFREETNWPKDYFESFAYLIDRLNNDCNKNENNNVKNIKDLVYVVLSHESKCSNSDCECKLFKVFPHSTPNPKDFKKLFNKRIGFLIETAFIRSELNTNLSVSLLLSEYFSIFKTNSFMAYSVLQSFMAINYNKMTFLQFIDFYSMQLYYIHNCKSIYQKGEHYVKFSTLFHETIQRKNLKKLLQKYCDNFTIIVNMKEAIENSIKFDYDDNGELIELSTKYLTQAIVNKIIKLVLIQARLYKTIYNTFINEKIKSFKIEFYYLMHLFLSLLGKKIGKKAKKALMNLNSNDRFTHLTQDEIESKLESYLNKHFKQNKKSYYVIIKCNKGFIIQYFSSELIRFLNFNHSSLIGEPFNNIFPRDFAKLHQKAMIKEMNTAKFFYHSKSSFIFDSVGYSYPCKLVSAFMPHLSKSLVIISKVVMKANVTEESQFFMLDKYFNLISLSKNLDTKYALNLELLKKCEINILEIFEINRIFLQKTFDSFNSKLEKYRTYLQGNTSEIFSRWFFISKHTLEEAPDLTNKIGKLRQCAKSMKKPVDNVVIETKVIERKRTNVFQNIMKMLTKFSEVDLKEENFKKFYQMQSTYSAASLYNSKNSLSKEKELSFKITIKAVCCYNTPFYNFSFYLDQDLTNSSPIPETTSSNNSRLIQSNKRFKDTLVPGCGVINNNNNTNTNTITNTNTNTNTKPSDTKYESITLQTKEESPILVKKNQIVNPEQKERVITLKDSLDNPSIKSLFWISNVAGIILVFILVFFQKEYFNSIEIMMIANDANNYQRDIMNQVFSTYLSFISHLSGVLENEIYPIDTYTNLTHETLSLYQQSFKYFSSSYMEYCISLNEKINQLEKMNQYISILHDWQNFTYRSDYSSEVNKLIYLGMKAVTDPIDKPSIIQDLCLFFQKGYLNKPTSPIKSSLGEFSFYIINNIQKIYFYVHAELYSVILLKGQTLFQSYIVVIWILEGLIFIYYMSILNVFYCLLRKLNDVIFKILIGMFLYSKTNNKCSIKNTTNNIQLNQKINSFSEIIKNFNETTYLDLKKKHKEKPTIIFEEQYANTSQSNITGRNATNSSTFNQLSNVSKTNYPLLLKRNSHNFNHKEDGKGLKSHNKATNLIEQKNIWATSDYIKYFKARNIWALLFLKLLTSASLVICILFSLSRLVVSYNYIRCMEMIEEKFSYFTGKYTLLISLFNNIRVSMLNDINSFNLIGDFNQYMTDLVDSQEIFSDIKSDFPLIGELYYQTNLKLNDSNFDIDAICNKDNKCYDTLRMKNNFCADGIQFGIFTILQKYNQIIKDFKNRPNTPLTQSELILYYRQNNLASLERTIDFVFLKVQRNLYHYFRIDCTNKGIMKQFYVLLVTIVSIAFTVLITICLMLALYTHINLKYNCFSKEVSNINNALFNY